MKPTPVQVETLRIYSIEHGPSWKAHLQMRWASGRHFNDPDAQILDQIKRELGPAWLDRYQLPE